VEADKKKVYRKQINKWSFTVLITGYILSLLIVIGNNIKDLKSGNADIGIIFFMATVFALPFIFLAIMAYKALMKIIINDIEENLFKRHMFTLKASFVGTITAWVIFYVAIWLSNAPGEMFFIPGISLIPLVGAGIGFMFGCVIADKYL